MLVLCFLLAGWQVCGGQSVWASRLCSVVTASYLTCDKYWPVPPPHLLSFTSSLTSLWQPIVRRGFCWVVTGLHGGLAVKSAYLLCVVSAGLRGVGGGWGGQVLKLHCISCRSKIQNMFEVWLYPVILVNTNMPPWLPTSPRRLLAILLWRFDVFLQICNGVPCGFVFLSGCHKWLGLLYSLH